MSIKSLLFASRCKVEFNM